MDVTKYTLTELYEIRKSIDQEKYPERYREIEEQISKLKDETEFKTGTYTIIEGQGARWLGILQVLLGLTGIAYFLSQGGNEMASSKVLIPVLANLIMVFGGVLLLLYKKVGSIVSAIGMLFFTLSFSLESFQYLLVQGIGLRLGYSDVSGHGNISFQITCNEKQITKLQIRYLHAVPGLLSYHGGFGAGVFFEMAYTRFLFKGNFKTGKEELISKLAELGLSKDEINKLVETFIYAMGLIKNEKPIRLDNSSQNDQIEECKSSDGLFTASC